MGREIKCQNAQNSASKKRVDFFKKITRLNFLTCAVLCVQLNVNGCYDKLNQSTCVLVRTLKLKSLKFGGVHEYWVSRWKPWLRLTENRCCRHNGAIEFSVLCFLGVRVPVFSKITFFRFRQSLEHR